MLPMIIAIIINLDSINKQISLLRRSHLSTTIDHLRYRTGVPYFCTVKPVRTHRCWSFSILGTWTSYSPTKLPTVHHHIILSHLTLSYLLLSSIPFIPHSPSFYFTFLIISFCFTLYISTIPMYYELSVVSIYPNWEWVFFYLSSIQIFILLILIL